MAVTASYADVYAASRAAALASKIAA